MWAVQKWLKQRVLATIEKEARVFAYSIATGVRGNTIPTVPELRSLAISMRACVRDYR